MTIFVKNAQAAAPSEMGASGTTGHAPIPEEDEDDEVPRNCYPTWPLIH